jgi:hypothetical protein
MFKASMLVLTACLFTASAMAQEDVKVTEKSEAVTHRRVTQSGMVVAPLWT